jgi:hypothetical protein
MPCDCPTDRLALAVPADYRDLLPESPAVVTVCPTCFAIEPADDETPTVSAAALTDISDAIPPDEDAAVPLVLALGLLSSSALYRDEIETLLRAVERAGVDPLLVCDRLATDPDIEPAADLARRRRQLAQLLS